MLLSEPLIDNEPIISTIMYDTVSIETTNLNNLGIALKGLVDVPSYDPTDREGFPLSCIACDGDVVYKDIGVTTTASDGMAWDEPLRLKCTIRFSKI